MKKSIIAAGAVSAVVAAMPIVGVFADPSISTVTDEIEITIASECAITTNTTSATQGVGDGTHTDRKFSAAMQNGELKELAGTSSVGAEDSATAPINVVCNDSSQTADNTWILTAVGGDGATTSTVLAAQNGNGTDIATGSATSGATSNWQMKVDVANGVTQTNLATYTNVPSSATTVANGTGSVTGAFTPWYRVYIGTSQAADTYVGHVTYTLTSPNS